jgi:hypothetical protein
MDKIILNVAIDLVNCFYGNSSIVFPKYYNNSKEKKRVSEQESKILFAYKFIKNNIKFAIEVPTVSKHMQTEKTPKSALFDLVTYKKNNLEFDWVLELKSKNPPIEHFTKDFEKMVRSDSNCIWFHTLKNANEETYNVLLEKFNKGITAEIENFRGNHIWKIAIVVLEKKELYMLDILLEKNKFTNISSIKQFFRTGLDDIIKGRKNYKEIYDKTMLMTEAFRNSGEID